MIPRFRPTRFRLARFRSPRRRHAAVAVAMSAALLLSACTDSGANSSAATVTANNAASGARGSAASNAGTDSAPPASGRSSSGGGGTALPAPGAPSPSQAAVARGAQPDGFLPTKLKPGQKPPQFVVVSFDGVGRHDKWQYWFDIMGRVPFHFTGFLSGTYLLSSASKLKYQGPGHRRGKASIGWNDPADLPVEIADVNESLARGNEIGTHFVGHFCSDNPPGGNIWNTADWNNELDQFFSLMRNVNSNNGLPSSVKLNLDPSEVRGERTPCLEGHSQDLFPALKAHGMTYDSSITRRGISWPTQSTNRTWQMGMAEFPMHGTHHFRITMDYNFYFAQRNASSNGVSKEQSARDSAQVLATYQDMYDATFHGNRAPLILGNHFNDWNNNAYSDAIGKFVLANCGKPDTYCVPFRDLIAWMKVQDPARLSQLQSLPPELNAG